MNKVLSYSFLPFLQQERDRKEWIKKQANILIKNVKY